MKCVAVDSLSLLRRSVLGVCLASVSAAVSCGHALAEDAVSAPALAAPAAAVPSAITPSALASGPAPAAGIALGSWMFYPTLFAGAVFDDNLYKTETGQVASWGVRLTPNLEADLDEGIHKATVYGTLDAQLYPGSNAALGQNASTVQGRTGFAYIWTPTEDIVTRVSLDYTRMSGPFGSTLITATPINSATSFVGATSSLNVSGFRQFTNTTTGTFYVQKTVTDAIFVRVGGSLQDLVYEQPPVGYTGGLSGYYGSSFLRVGAPLTPQITAFVEGGGDFHRYYSGSFYDAQSFRFVGGLSSDLIGLFRAEAYGGVQRQFSTYNTFAPVTAPTGGGRVTYYPTEYFTVAASADLSLGSAGGYGLSPAISAQNETLQVRLQADYALFEYWRASVRGGYAETWYQNSSVTSSTWLAGAGASYFFWTNWALTGDYQYTRVLGNSLGAASYVDNLVSLGVTYRY